MLRCSARPQLQLARRYGVAPCHGSACLHVSRPRRFLCVSTSKLQTERVVDTTPKAKAPRKESQAAPAQVASRISDAAQAIGGTKPHFDIKASDYSLLCELCSESVSQQIRSHWMQDLAQHVPDKVHRCSHDWHQRSVLFAGRNCETFLIFLTATYSLKSMLDDNTPFQA